MPPSLFARLSGRSTGGSATASQSEQASSPQPDTSSFPTSTEPPRTRRITRKSEQRSGPSVTASQIPTAAQSAAAAKMLKDLYELREASAASDVTERDAQMKWCQFTLDHSGHGQSVADALESLNVGRRAAFSVMESLASGFLKEGGRIQDGKMVEGGLIETVVG